MLSPNAKPCKAARKPQNYSYGKSLHARVKKKKKKTLNKVGKSKAGEMFFYYDDTPSCEGTSPRHGRKADTSSKVKPIE